MARVAVDLPEETIRDLEDLAERKHITRTEALVQAVETTKQIADRAPNGATIVPVSARAARRRHK